MLSLPFLLRVLVSLVLLSAAGAKLVDSRSFLGVTGYLVRPFGSDVWVSQWLSALVIAWEVFLGVALLFGVNRRWVWGSLGGTLLVFSGILIVLLFDPDAPSCACFGALGGMYGSEFEIGLVRNGAMLFIVGWFYVHCKSQAPRVGLDTMRHAEPAGDRGRDQSRGFTLVELLVSISIMGLLIGLMLPGLAGIREHARTSGSLSTQRQLVMAVDLYASDFDETFPYFQTPGNPYGPIVVNGVNLRFSYFSAGRVFWPNLLVPTYFDDVNSIAGDIERSGELNAIEGYPPDLIRSNFVLTMNAFASPRYWDSDDAPKNLRLLHRCRWSDVRYPSAKGLILDHGIGIFGTSTIGESRASLAMADGSAAMREWGPHDSERVVVRPFGAWMTPWIVISSRHGLAGRDF